MCAVPACVWLVDDGRHVGQLVLDQLQHAAGGQRHVGDAQTRARMSDDGLDLGRVKHGDRFHREPQQPLVEREGAVEARDGDTCVIEAQDGHPGGV